MLTSDVKNVAAFERRARASAAGSPLDNRCVGTKTKSREREIRFMITGARGRMGRALTSCVPKIPGGRVTVELNRGDDIEHSIEDCDAVIDFSHPSILDRLLASCIKHRRTLVIGTTGYTDAQVEQIKNAATHIPIVFAPNYSVGVNALFWLVERAAMILGPDFDLEIVEMHHRMKKDSPSGTAKRLFEILASTRNLDGSAARYGRHGIDGPRGSNEIGIHAIRGGDVICDHEVIYAAPGDRLEISHKASSRDTFALGAIKAAIWAHKRTEGLYDMQDVLGLR